MLETKDGAITVASAFPGHTEGNGQCIFHLFYLSHVVTFINKTNLVSFIFWSRNKSNGLLG